MSNLVVMADVMVLNCASLSVFVAVIDDRATHGLVLHWIVLFNNSFVADMYPLETRLFWEKKHRNVPTARRASVVG